MELIKLSREQVSGRIEFRNVHFQYPENDQEVLSGISFVAKPGQTNALQVWAYRSRPVFTFVRDDRPGSIRAQNWGEFYGQRNGYKAFFLREEFQGR